MYEHAAMGTSAIARNRQICRLRREGRLTLGGNRRLKIYGLLSCRSGKRMLTANRVFFSGEAEAITHGYRPCAHCMPEAYRRWKTRQG